MGRLPPIAHCSEVKTCVVSDVAGTENTASIIPVIRTHLNKSDKLSIVRLSSNVFLSGQISNQTCVRVDPDTWKSVSVLASAAL